MVQHNLPPQPTSFVGRDSELAEITRLLTGPECRLLTLVGPGGIGKTRLAIQAAAEIVDAFADGVFFIPLQPLSSIDYLVPAIAEAIQLSFFGQEDPQGQLLNYLRDKHVLLVMDNFEHLLAGTHLLSSMMGAAPKVKILITSREVLDLQEEWIRPVRGLKYPQDLQDEQVENYSALQLFYERARRVQADFPLTEDLDCAIRICQLVQGMPLAIEMAAAWLKVLPCREIAKEIQRSLDFLSTTMRNIPERHRNIRAVFEQSWRSLGGKERDVFKRLSVFQGGFQREAANAVASAGLHTLQELVDKSLLRVSPSGRYEIHELLRQFAVEKLSERPDDRQQVLDLHSAYYADYLRRQENLLKGPEQIPALAAVDAEIDNIRTAWRWSVEQGNEPEIIQSMGSLFLYYQLRTRIQEGAEAFQRAAAQLKEKDVQSRIADKLQVVEAWFRATAGEYRLAANLYTKGFSLLKEGDIQETLAMVLGGMTFIDLHEERPWDLMDLQRLYQELLTYFQEAGNHWAIGWSLYSLGAVAHFSKASEQAMEPLQASLEHFRAQGDRWGSTWVLNLLGMVAIELEAYPVARQYFEETFRICQEVGDRGGVAFSLAQLGSIAARQQEYESSLQYLSHAVRVAFEMKREPFIGWNLFSLAETLEEWGYKERAVEIMAFLCIYITEEEAQRYIQDRLKKLEAQLSPQTFFAAKLRGEADDIDSVVRAVTTKYARAVEGVVAPVAPGDLRSLSGLPLEEPLSERELEVLKLIAKGLSNREIAREIVVTVGTVKKHINNIFGKLQVNSRTQAIARGRELKLLSDTPDQPSINP